MTYVLESSGHSMGTYSSKSEAVAALADMKAFDLKAFGHTSTITDVKDGYNLKARGGGIWAIRIRPLTAEDRQRDSELGNED